MKTSGAKELSVWTTVSTLVGNGAADQRTNGVKKQNHLRSDFLKDQGDTGPTLDEANRRCDEAIKTSL
jgi:hypothetical protein